MKTLKQMRRTKGKDQIIYERTITIQIGAAAFDAMNDHYIETLVEEIDGAWDRFEGDLATIDSELVVHS